MAKITITDDGLVEIDGAAIINGPNGKTALFPAEDMARFLDELVAGSADTDEDWDFMELLRQRGTGEAA